MPQTKSPWWIALASAFVALCLLALSLFHQKAEQLRCADVLERQGAELLWRIRDSIEWMPRPLRLTINDRRLPFSYPVQVTLPTNLPDAKAAAEALSRLRSVSAVGIIDEEGTYKRGHTLTENTIVPGELLASLSHMSKLRELTVIAHFPPDGWKQLGTLPNLKRLYICEDTLVKGNFPASTPFPNLEHLTVIAVDPFARSLPILARFKGLKVLDLREASITEEIGAEFKSALPGTIILFADPP